MIDFARFQFYGGMANDPMNWEDISYDPMTMQIKPAAKIIAVSAGLPVFEHSTSVAEYLECSKTSNAHALCTSTTGPQVFTDRNSLVHAAALITPSESS